MPHSRSVPIHNLNLATDTPEPPKAAAQREVGSEATSLTQNQDDPPGERVEMGGHHGQALAPEERHK